MQDANSTICDAVANPDGKYAISGVSASDSSDMGCNEPVAYIPDKDIIPENSPINSKGNNKVGAYYGTSIRCILNKI